MLSEIDWDFLHNQCPDDPDGSLFVELFRIAVLLVCCICTPNKLSDQQRPKTEHFRKIYDLTEIKLSVKSPQGFKPPISRDYKDRRRDKFIPFPLQRRGSSMC